MSSIARQRGPDEEGFECFTWVKLDHMTSLLWWSVLNAVNYSLNYLQVIHISIQYVWLQQVASLRCRQKTFPTFNKVPVNCLATPYAFRLSPFSYCFPLHVWPLVSIDIARFLRVCICYCLNVWCHKGLQFQAKGMNLSETFRQFLSKYNNRPKAF